MNPYTTAWNAYHSLGEPTWPLHYVIAEHFRHGTIISTPETFLLARLVHAADPDEFHLSPLQSRENGDCWMIWLAAGNLHALLRLLDLHPTPWISFTRRDSNRVRRISTAEILRHVSQSTQAPAARSPASLRHRPRESSRGP